MIECDSCSEYIYLGTEAMAALYVTSLANGAGRTAVAASLASILAGLGRRAGYFKPLTVLEAPAPAGFLDPDTSFCKEALDLPEPASALAPAAVAAETLRSGLGGPLRATIQQRFAELSRGKDAVIIEGLPASPETGQASAEIAELADAVVLDVVRYHRDTSLEQILALKERFGERLRGVILNAVPAQSLRIAREKAAPALEAAGIPALAIVPEDRLLLGFAVADYGQRLGGRILNDLESSGEIVESILIGAMVLDPSDLYYERKENKALITRGDRPDLQWSALESSTRCLILTENIEPIPYVMDKAAGAGVPVMVVPSGTLDTVAAIEGFVTSPAFHYLQKLRRFTALLQPQLDLAVLGL